MGLFDLFKKSTAPSGVAGSGNGRVDKLERTVTNAYTQTGERYSAMLELLKDGSEDALVALLTRFTITSTKTIEDEEEKGWVYTKLRGRGPSVMPAIKRFCLKHDNIAWALRIVEDVADEQSEWDLLNALLEQHPPGYERDPSKKLQLLAHLAEIEDDRVAPALIGYLEDPDEGVRIAAADALLDIGDDQARERLAARVGDEREDSLRLRSRVLSGFARLGWSVEPHTEAVRARLGSEFELRDSKVIPR